MPDLTVTLDGDGDLSIWITSYTTAIFLGEEGKLWGFIEINYLHLHLLQLSKSMIREF